MLNHVGVMMVPKGLHEFSEAFFSEPVDDLMSMQKRRPSHVMLHPTVCVILESNSLIGCIYRYTYDTFTEWHHAKMVF